MCFAYAQIELDCGYVERSFAESDLGQIDTKIKKIIFYATVVPLGQ